MLPLTQSVPNVINSTWQLRNKVWQQHQKPATNIKTAASLFVHISEFPELLRGNYQSCSVSASIYSVISSLVDNGSGSLSIFLCYSLICHSGVWEAAFWDNTDMCCTEDNWSHSSVRFSLSRHYSFLKSNSIYTWMKFQIPTPFILPVSRCQPCVEGDTAWSQWPPVWAAGEPAAEGLLCNTRCNNEFGVLVTTVHKPSLL